MFTFIPFSQIQTISSFFISMKCHYSDKKDEVQLILIENEPNSLVDYLDHLLKTNVWEEEEEEEKNW